MLEYCLMTFNHSQPIRNILFVCTGNCSRSVMAASIFRALAATSKSSLQVESAGTDAQPGLAPTENTRKLLEQHGIPHPDHRAKICTQELIENADLIFVMEPYHQERLLKKFPKAKEKVHLLLDHYPGIEPWIKTMGIPDPLGMNSSFYENVYHLIQKSCTTVLEKIEDKSGL